MRVLAIIALFVQCTFACAQFSDSFEDGNLNSNPSWQFNGNDFEILAGKLHSKNSTSGNLQFGISAPLGIAEPAYIGLDFELGINPSGVNYFDFFIGADSNVMNAKNGFIIRVGDTKDNIVLYRLSNGNKIQLIASKTGILNTSSSQMRLRLLRSANGNIVLYHFNSLDQTWATDGTMPDTIHLNYKYCGLKIQQSGTTAIGKHFFDNVYFGSALGNIKPPSYQNIIVHKAELVMDWDQIITQVDTADFVLNGTIHPNRISIDSISENRIHIHFNGPFKVNQTQILSYKNAKNNNNQICKPGTVSFKYIEIDTPVFGDVIFTEIMANPAPGVGIFPEDEYLEIQNISGKFLRLFNCTISDAVSKYNLPDTILFPGEIALITKNSSSFGKFGLPKWIGCSGFPSLNNDGDYLSIKNQKSQIISEIQYTNKWHSAIWKKNGGWSLERMDSALWCIDEGNWTSAAANGGSPGRRNTAVKTIKPQKFKLLRTYCPDSMHIRLLFNYPVANALINNLRFFFFKESGEYPSQITISNNQIVLEFAKRFLPNVVYHLKVDSVQSCFGDAVLTAEVPFGFAYVTVDSAQVTLNEILFDPFADESDFVEIVNISNRIVDLKSLKIANADDNGNIKTVTEVFAAGYDLFPGNYVALTTDMCNTIRRYAQTDSQSVLEVSALPVFPNDKGHAILLNKTGTVLDKMQYNQNMHSAIVSNSEGISLEKINPMLNSSVANNWTSASSVSGFGTPGKINSQFKDTTNYKNKFALEENWISPDNDGDHDLLHCNYFLDKPGYILNAKLFAENGSSVCTVYNQLMLNQSGELYWNGSCETNLLNPGNYILFVELFHPAGNVMHRKLTFSILAKT